MKDTYKTQLNLINGITAGFVILISIYVLVMLNLLITHDTYGNIFKTWLDISISTSLVKSIVKKDFEKIKQKICIIGITYGFIWLYIAIFKM